jgi:hypothetical protein
VLVVVLSDLVASAVLYDVKRGLDLDRVVLSEAGGGVVCILDELGG